MSTLFDKEDLYADSYYYYDAMQPQIRASPDNYTTKHEISSTTTTTTTTTTMFRGTLAILSRVGFLLVQIGSVPVSNVNLILLQNLVDFGAVTIVYILVGFTVSFGGDHYGLVGEGRWIGDSRANKDEAVIGWEAVLVASAIYTCGTAGRMHTVGYLVISVLLSGLLQPFLLHWAWSSKGWMASNKFLGKRVLFRDYAGATVVHLVGSLTGLLGCMILGRRLLRLRDLDEASLPTEAPGTTFAGYFLVFLGLQGLALPNPAYESFRTDVKHVPHVLVNNFLAASACVLLVVALHFALEREAFDHWTMTRCVQGAISGVVTVSAGVDLYSPLIAIAVSCIGGVAFYLVSRRVFRSALEDYCNIVAIHLVCALLGSFLAPLLVTLDAASVTDIHTIVTNATWQVICLLVVVCLVTAVTTPAFLLLELCAFLRNRSEFLNHLRSTVALGRGPPRSYMQRLFLPDGECLYLQPGSIPKGPRGANLPGTRTLEYGRTIAWLEQTRPPELRGPPRSDAKEEPSGKKNLFGSGSAGGTSTVDPSTRVKKLRQIYTIPSAMIQSPEVVANSGGTGESVGLFEHWISRTSENRKIDFIRAYHPAEEFNRVEDTTSFIVDESRRSASMYRLHRTTKRTNLLSEASSEKHEFNVEVLIEPRREGFQSSDSEDDRCVESSDDFSGKYKLATNVICDSSGEQSRVHECRDERERDEAKTDLPWHGESKNTSF